MSNEENATISVDGRTLTYRVIASKTATKLRLRVGPAGTQVILPSSHKRSDVAPFVTKHADWIAEQQDRAAKLRAAFKPLHRAVGEILFRGVPTRVRFVFDERRRAQNVVVSDGDVILVTHGAAGTTPARSLENWLRRHARSDLVQHIESLALRLRVRPGRIYVMSQRTKWANCSGLGNLSFNFRCVMAPTHVLLYLVTHEVVHLLVPDHSRRFWLTVNSLCPNSERARQWLSANSHHLMIDLPTAASAP